MRLTDRTKQVIEYVNRQRYSGRWENGVRLAIPRDFEPQDFKVKVDEIADGLEISVSYARTVLNHMADIGLCERTRKHCYAKTVYHFPMPTGGEQ